MNTTDSGKQGKPSELDRDTFVAVYGGVFEHSPWIAERAFDAGLDQSADSASGLHEAMKAQFRSADDTMRMDVLLAHPDLAGKLAAANRLTAESTSEQAGAGLDSLTDEERTTFTDLNSRYTQKFGFPFIIAVKGLKKPEILEAFQTRINNNKDEEFSTACLQVEKIALLRLGQLLP